MNPVTPHMPDRPSLDDGIDPLRLFSFAGRDKRRVWWAIQSFGFVVFIIAMSLIAPNTGTAASPIRNLLMIMTFIAYSLLTLSSNVRRLHDRGKPGGLVLVGLIPIAGQLWLLIQLGFLPGMKTTNEYGDPL